MIRASVSGIGSPMWPGLRTPLKGFACVTGEHSVSPYPSTTWPPSVTRSNSFATATGSGAAPETQALIDFRSNSGVFGFSLIAIYRRGTPGNNDGSSFWISSNSRWMSRGFGTGISFAALSIVRFIASSP